MYGVVKGGGRYRTRDLAVAVGGVGPVGVLSIAFEAAVQLISASE